MIKLIDSLKKDENFKNGILFSIYAFIGRGISYLLLIVLASFILPDDYGKISLFNTIVMLIGFFITFSTYGYIGNSYFKEDTETFHKDFTTIFIYLLLSTFFVALVILLLSEDLSIVVGLNSCYLWVALIICFFNIFFQFITDYLRFREKVGWYGILNLSNALLNAILSVLFVVGFSQGWIGRINAHLLVTVMFGIIGLFFCIKKKLFDFNVKKERMKMILLWGLPQIPHMATNWIRQGCDQYIINYNYSTQEVGLFSFALNMVGIITMIGMAFNSSNSVTIYQILSGKSSDKLGELRNITRKIFVVFFVATFVILIGNIIIVPIVLPKYVESLPFFCILSIYGFLVCMYYLFCNYLFYYGYTKNLMYITFGSSILHLFLSLLLTQFSLYYTTVIYVVSQSLCVGFVYQYSRIILKNELARFN